jgi:hypothetical protein
MENLNQKKKIPTKYLRISCPCGGYVERLDKKAHDDTVQHKKFMRQRKLESRIESDSDDN